MTGSEQDGMFLPRLVDPQGFVGLNRDNFLLTVRFPIVLSAIAGFTNPLFRLRIVSGMVAAFPADVSCVDSLVFSLSPDPPEGPSADVFPRGNTDGLLTVVSASSCGVASSKLSEEFGQPDGGDESPGALLSRGDRSTGRF